jgi:hypothetical protein
MDHAAIRHTLSEYLDNAVSGRERSEIEEHLKACPACGAALMELRKTLDHVKALEEVEPPAWMTQKIMAEVRSAAKEQKNIFQRLFPLRIRLPLQATAVLFLAVTAFTLYRAIQPIQDQASAPISEFSKKQEALETPAAETETSLRRDAVRPSKKPAQAPEYKALDMKLAQEKPAPPVPMDEPRAPAPAAPTEQPLQGESKGRSTFAKQKSLDAVSAGKSGFTITLRVKDVAVAAAKVEQDLSQLGGTIARKDKREKKIIYTISVSAQELSKLKERLKHIGEIGAEAAPQAPRGSRIEIRLELTEGTE